MLTSKEKGLTGAPVHTGNWGTKDYGYTETAQNLIAGAMALLQGKSPSLTSQLNTSQGGSNLIDFGGGQSQSQGQTNTAKTSSYSDPYAGAQSRVLGASIIDGGGSTGGNYRTGGSTGGNYRTGGTTGGNTGGDTGGTTGGTDYSAEFNQALSDYYAPAFNRLGDLEQSYSQQLPISQQQVETSYGEALQPLNERLASGTANIQQQRMDVEKGKQSAISQARQLYNELSQRGLSRFGGTGSAGQAYSEIIGRQTAENMGNAEGTAAISNEKLSTELKNLGDFVSQQKITLSQKKQTALDEIKKNFDDKIREINSQRGQLEQSKAEQRIAELQNARQRAYQIEDAATAYQRQLDLFNQQKQATLSSQYNLNTGISSQALNAFKSLVPVVGTVAAAKLAGVDLSQVMGTIKAPNASWKDLGDGRWINLETQEIRMAPDQFSAQSIVGDQG